MALFRVRFLLGVCLVSAGLGCGSKGGPTAHLQGTVTIAGKPIPADAKAFVTFATGSGKEIRTASAEIVGGKYDCANAPQGSVRALFEITQPVGPKKMSERTGQEYQETKSLVPANAAGGQEIEVSGDKADQNFDLAA